MNSPSSLKQQLVRAIRKELPVPVSQENGAYVAYWQAIVRCFASLYRDVASLERWLLGTSTVSAPPTFVPADILKAELFTDPTGVRLRQAVDQEVTSQCSALAAAVTDRVLPTLSDAGRVYRVQQFGASTIRLSLKRSHDSVECDLLCQPHPKPRRILRRVCRRSPRFLHTLLSAHSAHCVRVADGQQRLLPLPSRTVELVQLGEYAFHVHPSLVPPEPRTVAAPATARHSLVGTLLIPDLRTVVATVAFAAPLVLLLYGVVESSPVASLGGGFALMSILLFFLKRAGHATNP